MARPVQPRASYLSDARYLSTLMEAVEKDKTKPPEWRQEVIASLQSVVIKFINA